MRDAFSIGGNCGGARFRHWLGIEGFHVDRQTRTARQLDVAGQEMRVTGLLGAGLTRKDFDERGLALYQVLQAGLHGAEVVERMHAFGADAELARSLRTAQE